MWLLSLLPDSFMYFIVVAICLLGIAGYVIGSFGGIFPMLKPYANTIKLASIAVLVVGVYLYGGYTTEMSWRDKSAELKQKVAVSEEKSKTANAEVQIKYITKVKVIHDTKVVTKEVLREKAVAIDNCSIPDVITVLNKAAAKPLDLSLPAEVTK